MDKLLEWLSTGWIGRPLKVLGWISQRNRLAQHKLLRYAEHGLGLGRGGPRVTGAGEVTNVRANALRSGRERLRKGIRSELAYGAQTAQEGNTRGDRVRIRRICHRRAFCRGAGSRKISSI